MIIYSLYYTHKPGGFCKRLYRLLNTLADDNHIVTYLSLDPPPSSLNKKVVWNKISFPLSRRNGLIFWLLFFIWTSVYLIWLTKDKSGRWLCFSPFYFLLLLPAKIINGFSAICFVRSKLSTNSDFYPYKITERFSNYVTIKFADKIILQTKANLNIALKYTKELFKLKILANNIDNIHERKKDLGGKPLHVVTSGVFTKRKNLSLLFDTWKLLNNLSKQKNSAQITLTIVGIIKSELPSNLPENIRILPWQDGLDDIYNSSDIYIHPSIHEGMPNSVLEAMSYGLVTLVADTEELTELVDNNKLCFKPDNPAEFANLIFDLQNNQNLFHELQDIVRNRAKKLCFDWNKKAKELFLN